jgi:hypothetical protein
MDLAPLAPRDMPVPTTCRGARWRTRHGASSRTLAGWALGDICCVLPCRRNRSDQPVFRMRARVGADFARRGSGFVGMPGGEVIDRDAEAGSNRREHANEDSSRQRSPRIGWLGCLRHNTRLRRRAVGRLRGCLMKNVESGPATARQADDRAGPLRRATWFPMSGRRAAGLVVVAGGGEGGDVVGDGPAAGDGVAGDGPTAVAASDSQSTATSR